MTAATGIPAELRGEIQLAGYYPDLVLDSLATALGDEPVVDFVVHHEATFDREELRRHATVLAVTKTRLVMQHTDEHPADEVYASPYASSVAEAVRLSSVDTVVVTRIVVNPAQYTAGHLPAELLVTIGWGSAQRLELEPASCGDPECQADHGFSGSSSTEDISLRFAAAADGDNAVDNALRFARTLSQLVGKPIA